MIETLEKKTKKYKNITGIKFNRLTAIKRTGIDKWSKSVWECLCDCGNITFVSLSDLQSGNTCSCGCLNKEIAGNNCRANFIGKRFGNLVVEELSNVRYKNKNCLWRCQCDCGNFIFVPTGRLSSGNTKSCGCLWIKKTRKSYGEASCNDLYREYRYGAENRNLEFTLTIEEFRDLTKLNCFYCGIAPNQVTYKKSKNFGLYIYNGIDRVNNSQGYTPENCVSCCKQCNRAKMDYSIEEFYDWVHRLYNYKHLNPKQTDYQI